MNIYVAFLRGINVGGKNTVSMASLKACFESLGYQHVKTYINSGNVVFGSPQSNPRKLETQIEAALHATFKLPIMVVVRSKQQIDHLLSNLPSSWSDGTQKCNIIFLHAQADSPEIMKLFAPKFEIEEVHYTPGAILWSADLNALTRSLMLKLSTMPIYQQMTVRTPNTVRKLAELMKQANT